MQRNVGLFLLAGALVLGACGGGGDDGTAAGSKDTNFSGKGGGDFCQKARDFEENTKSSGDSSPEGVKAEFSQLTKAVKDLVDAAPSEIKPDAENVGDYFAKVNDLYEKYDYDASKIPEEESAKLDSDDPAIKASSERVETYFEKVCKIDSDGDGDTDGVQQQEPAEDPAAEEPTSTTVAG